MRVYRPEYTKKGVKKKCRVWYVQTTVNGKRFRKSTGCRDRRSAIQKARELVLAAERQSAGLQDQLDVHQRRPLREHLDDFEATLRARGVGEQYLADRMRCLRGFVSHAGCKRLVDLDDSSASRWLAEERGKGLSARTVNRRYQALRQFGRWLVKANRLERAPFSTLRPLNEQADRRRQRRSLSADELRLLVEAAKSRPLTAATRQRVRKGVTDAERRRLVRLGETRALVYQLAAGTGLRRNELRQLRWRDLDLKAGWITVPAATAKSRKDQRVPLRTDLVQMLRDFRSRDVRMRDRVIPPRLFPSLRALKRDLAEAGIVRRELVDVSSESGEKKRPREVFHTKDDRGRVVDFHALRYTFVTQLAKAGVHPRIAQALARHAKIETTMAVYTDIRDGDLREAVERLDGSQGE